MTRTEPKAIGNPYKSVAKKTVRVVFEIEAQSIKSFDEWAAGAGYRSRTEALRRIVVAQIGALGK